MRRSSIASVYSVHGTPHAAGAGSQPTDVLEALHVLSLDLRALVAALRAPTIRQATVHLPTGPATMIVRETRK